MTVSLLGECKMLATLPIPFFLMRVSAGFPSPAQDYIEKSLDLNELCIKHPSATYMVRVEGDSMIDAGVFHGDILIVDRSLKATHDDIVIAELSGEMTVKLLELRPYARLVPKNRHYPAIEGLEMEGVSIFGVVTNVIRRLKE